MMKDMLELTYLLDQEDRSSQRQTEGNKINLAHVQLKGRHNEADDRQKKQNEVDNVHGINLQKF
jgi:hypothetical protein